MKNLLFAIFCLVACASFASSPAYEVKKETIDVFVTQDSAPSVEMIASVNLQTLAVKDFSEQMYLVEVIYLNDSVAGIKTILKDKEFLYVFELTENAKRSSMLPELKRRTDCSRIQNLSSEIQPEVKNRNRFTSVVREVHNELVKSFKNDSVVTRKRRVKLIS